MTNVDVIYCDNHLLAVVKPAGLVTQPSGHHRDSLESRAKGWIKQTCGKPGRVFLEAVHRLDRPVTGVVLFGRTSKALSRLNAGQREGRCSKVYVAVVEGVMAAGGGRLRDCLVHGSHRADVVAADTAAARECLLTYDVLETDGGMTAVRIDLMTGRYHQIRAQFAHAGHPVVGDRQYGSSRGRGGPGIALHHLRLTVDHPTRGTPVSFAAPVPEGFPWALFESRARWVQQVDGSEADNE